ncbi:DotH/IcmK family type IV secretion protein [Labrenzia sp. DG1229]|uniref:DotH/IcmK family type IV secretion protein n=1 Tax=Labrenzia sp. DG1229 TaxID=681847 RepID=UPI000AE16170|nr:DotH/IcmK family type IV secretion protein [Labrenzia sp. DG1229]
MTRTLPDWPNTWAVLLTSLVVVTPYPAPAQQTILRDATGDETVPAGTEVQAPLPSPAERPIATLPDQNGERTVVTIENAQGTEPPALPTGKEPLSQNELNQRLQSAETTQPTAVGDFPIIGATELLKSLDELDRQLTPEEITAYGAALQAQIPMTPEMIFDYRRRLDESQKAAATPPSGRFPNAITDTVRLSLRTARSPEVLLTGPDTVSVMAFYDRTGEPWPIASYVIGRSGSFQVYAMQEGSNQLAVAPLVPHGFSNIVVSLVGESRPLVFDVRTNSLNTHYRRDFIVEGLGPNANPTPLDTSSREQRSRASDNVMMAFATGTDIPGEAKRLRTDNPAVRAWQYNGAIYLQSRETIISPPASQILTAAGQVKAYRIQPTGVALISVGGVVSKVRISR